MTLGCISSRKKILHQGCSQAKLEDLGYVPEDPVSDGKIILQFSADTHILGDSNQIALCLKSWQRAVGHKE